MSKHAATGRTDFGGERRRVQVSFPEETKTEQSHKAACDVNNIMARYTATGVMDHIRAFEPVYADVTTEDYQSAMNVVANAQTMFEELPSTIRRHFGDDVSQFLRFCAESPDPGGQLQGLAEEYRKRALGNDTPVNQEPAPPATPSETPTEATPPEETSV